MGGGYNNRTVAVCKVSRLATTSLDHGKSRPSHLSGIKGALNRNFSQICLILVARAAAHQHSRVALPHGRIGPRSLSAMSR